MDIGDEQKQIEVNRFETSCVVSPNNAPNACELSRSNSCNGVIKQGGRSVQRRVLQEGCTPQLHHLLVLALLLPQVPQAPSNTHFSSALADFGLSGTSVAF